MSLAKEHELTHNSWRGMRARCNNKNQKSWKRYGGVGIKVCPEWSKFRNFLRDMGERPSKDHQIERKDNYLGYFLDNCCWATRSEQGKNRRPEGRYSGIESGFARKSLRDWEKVSPVSRVSIKKRLLRGVDPESAIHDLPRVHRKFDQKARNAMCELFAADRKVADIARIMGADPSTVWRIVHS